jgi:hypothetical protein
MAYRTYVRYASVMHDNQLNQLVARHAVFRTTAMHMQHPGDDYEGWRHDWARSTAWSTRSTA